MLIAPRRFTLFLTTVLFCLVSALPAVAQDAAGLKEQVVAAQTALAEAEAAVEGAEDADAAAAAVADAQADLDSKIDALQSAVGAMEESGQDVSEYQAFLIEVDPAANLSLGGALSLGEKWAGMARDWATENGPVYVVRIVLFLVIFMAFKLLAGIIGRIVRRALNASKLQPSKLFEEFLVNITRKMTVFAGLIIGLQTVGIDMGPILAGVGVLGFVIGFALQDTLGNFAAGIMLLLYRPYDVGDVVTAGGVTGKVETMTLVSTTIATADNIEITVPNGSIWGGVITNVSARSTRRVDMVAGIGYSDDVDKAEAVLLDILEKNPKVLAEPAPVVKLHELADSSVNYLVRPWCNAADYWDVKFEITKEIKKRFDAEGISIPFPQQDVHLITDEPIAHKGA